MSKTVRAAILNLAHVLGEPFDDQRLAGYEDALSHLSDPIIAGACRTATHRCKYMPRPAELLEMAREFRERTQRQPIHQERLPDNVMAMNAAVWPHFMKWVNTLCLDNDHEDRKKARDDFLWALQAQSKVHGVAIPWSDFALYGITLPWETGN